MHHTEKDGLFGHNALPSAVHDDPPNVLRCRGVDEGVVPDVSGPEPSSVRNRKVSLDPAVS